MALSGVLACCLQSICHRRFRSLSLAKATELSWYCLLRCVGLLLSFLPLPVPSAFSGEGSRTVVVSPFRVYLSAVLLCRTGSVRCLSAAAAERSWYYCTIEKWASVAQSNTAGSACLFNRRPPNCHGIVPSGLFAIEWFFYFLLKLPLIFFEVL